MLPDFSEHPGQWFVVATLLPLVSFLVIFLTFGLWALCRPAREEGGLGATLYRLAGGDTPSQVPAYIALGAIAAAFICCAIGFGQFLRDDHERTGHREALKKLEEAHHAEEGEGEHAQHHEQERAERLALAHLDQRWSGSIDWLRIRPSGLPDAESGTVLTLGFRIDMLNAVMFVMVTFVATLIHLFSMGYMTEELQPEVEDHQVHTESGHLHRRGRYGRFFMFLSLFCFSMLNLILADNLFQVFLSWELVGICSFLLIGFYFERQSASNAANKAFITNRVGDAGFILGLLIVWTTLGTFNFEEIFARIRSPHHDSHGELKLAHKFVRANPDPDAGAGRGGHRLQIDPSGSEIVLFPRIEPTHFDGLGPRVGGDHGEEPLVGVLVKDHPKATEFGSMPYWLLIAAGLGIFLGCVGKSAQFPLQVWLPDAMEGPTPVSALIHAATMVAAGVYLVGRCYPLFAPEALLVIAYTGGITLFVAASIAVVMTDIKKVLAYSTVSQLGYMMLGLGVGGWAAGLLHLLTHAFFKALLFLGSGSVIHGCHHEQDMLKMGGLYPKMKITAITMLMGVLAIAGVPLFSGWYSKDAVLGSALDFVTAHPAHGLLFLLPLVTAGITTFYMFRMWFLTFAGHPRDHHVYEHATESPWKMTLPLILLAVLSVCVAWGWPLWDAEASWLGHKLEAAQPESVEVDFVYGLAISEANHMRAGLLALVMVAVGLLFASLLYLYHVLDSADAQRQVAGIYAFLSHKWYFDELYSAIVVRPALVVGHAFKWFDATVIDGVLHGVAHSTIRVARWDGLFDNTIIDGLVNLVGKVVAIVGGSLRPVQTGSLRGYVLFLVLAAIGLFAALSYFVTMVVAG